MIDQSSLRAHARNKTIAEAKVSYKVASQLKKQTAFLSHSHKDEKLALGVQGFLQSNGWKVYIDWQDLSMPSSPNQETALRIKIRIESNLWFLYLATQNSAQSRWCPWEIGYADGVKDIERIVVIPTQDDLGNYYGNEYMRLYKRITVTEAGYAYVFQPSGDIATRLSNMK